MHSSLTWKRPVKLDADGAYRVNDVGVGIAFITDPWGTRIELNERPKAVYLPERLPSATRLASAPSTP
jgi:hypothetical protein